MVTDPIVEQEAHRGGQTAIKVNQKMLHDIQTLLSRLVGKARQLIDNETTNIAESWMHIRSKFDGAKVINRSQSGSWEHCCMGSALQQNIGKQWGPQVWQNITNSTPNTVFAETAKLSADKQKKNKKRKEREDVKAKRRSRKYARTEDDTHAARRAYRRQDGDIAPDECSGDVPPEHLEQLKSGFYEAKVVVTASQANEIERGTVDQVDNDQWLVERRKRITASNVGSIIKMRKTTRRSNKVKQLLYTRFKGNAATRYGIDNEDATRAKYITHMRQNGHTDLTVESCGLFVSVSNPWLTGTPDGLVNDPDSPQPLGLVEMKNPHSAKSKTLKEATTNPAFCLQEEGNSYKLKRKHDYFHQIQCQLHCTNREWCDFVVNTDKEMHVERIYRDGLWWESNMDKLKQFYFASLLPELACPMHFKGGIRD